MPHATAPHSTLERCIQECLSCYTSCAQTVNHCLELGGEHAARDHIATLLACAEICRTSAHVMLLGSQFHRDTCRACSNICRACEADCRSMAHDDEAMARCADVCRSCAESCARMAEST
jgi:hypothetical protein